MPLMSCWVKTSMPARLVLRRPLDPASVKLYQGAARPATAATPSSACPVGEGVPGWSARAGTKVPHARCRPDHWTEMKMGRYLLLWLLGVPIPILLLIWAFGGLH